MLSGPNPQPTHPGEVMPLVGYSPFWLWLGIALLVALVLYYLLAWAFTRTPEATEAPPVEAEHVDVDAARAEAEAQISYIACAAARGELTERSAYEQFSATVREFVATATGIPADKMTLAELSCTRLAGTAHTVAQLYPGIFSEHADYDLAAAERDARAVISGWN